MAIHFDRLVSVRESGANFAIRVLSPANEAYDFTITAHLGVMLVAGLRDAAPRLAQSDSMVLLTPTGIQPIVTDQMLPGFVIEFAPGLELAIQLPAAQLASLRACIDQIARCTIPQGSA